MINLFSDSRRSSLLVIAEKYSRLAGGFVATAAIARSLGSDEFGVLSFALSIIFFFSLLANFGLDALLPKEVVENPDKPIEILGVALSLRALSAFMSLIFLILISFFFVSSLQARDVIWLLSGMVFFQAHTLIQLYFNSIFSNTYSVALAFVLQLLFLAAKLVASYFDVGVYGIAALMTLEHAAMYLGMRLLLVFERHGYLFSLSAYFRNKIYELAKASAPLLLSGLVIAVYNRLDQVMIFYILGESPAGQYAAAARLSEGVGYLCGIAITAIYPLVIKESIKEYRQAYFTQYFRVVFYILAVVAVLVGFAAEITMVTIFGQEFISGALVLPLMLWSVTFSNIGVISTQWLVIENKQIYRLYRSIAGVILNIILNFILIPRYGLIGGAVATLISQIFVSFISNASVLATRHIFYTQVNALFFTRFNINKSVSEL